MDDGSQPIATPGAGGDIAVLAAGRAGTCEVAEHGLDASIMPLRFPHGVGMPITGYDKDAEKIGLFRPATRHLRWKLLGAFLGGVLGAVLLAYIAKWLVP